MLCWPQLVWRVVASGPGSTWTPRAQGLKLETPPPSLVTLTMRCLKAESPGPLSVKVTGSGVLNRSANVSRVVVDSSVTSE